MTSRPKQPETHRDWLNQVLPKHERLAPAVHLLLENQLKQKQIQYLSISSRAKNLHGALEKIDRKKYRDPPKQLTDLSGIRVITYLDEHVAKISELIRGLFDVDPANSKDRSEILGDDKVGYRSTHFVCTLGAKRSVQSRPW